MTARHFTALVRDLDVVFPRRAALLAGGNAIALIAAWHADPLAAKRRRKRKKRKRCKGGTTKCGKTCANLVSSGDHCGACGHGCLSGGCVHAACTCTADVECPDGCVCDGRLEGGSACRGPSISPGVCFGDEDCPLGSFCVAAVQACAVPCPG